MGNMTFSKAWGGPTLSKGQIREPLTHIGSAHLYWTLLSPAQ